MQRITITLDDELMEDLDALIASRGYASRSEAIRDLARSGIHQALLEDGAAETCIAVMSFVFEHETRALAQRLLGCFHSHHDLTISSTHLPLDHHTGLQVVILRGPTKSVRDFAESIETERGVRHARLVIVPALFGTEEHVHGPHATPHTHVRTR